MVGVVSNSLTFGGQVGDFTALPGLGLANNHIIII